MRGQRLVQGTIRHVPQSDLTIPITRRQQCAVRREGQRPHLVPMPLESNRVVIRVELPHLHHTGVVAGRQMPAVDAERHPFRRLAVHPTHGGLGIAAGDLPHPDLLVLTQSRQQLAIIARHGVDNGLTMAARRRGDERLFLHVPKPQGTVGATANQQASVGGEDDGAYLVAVPERRADDLSAGILEYGRGAVGAGRGGPITDWAEREL